jgi:hypothetical protein
MQKASFPILGKILSFKGIISKAKLTLRTGSVPWARNVGSYIGQLIYNFDPLKEAKK